MFGPEAWWKRNRALFADDSPLVHSNSPEVKDGSPSPQGLLVLLMKERFLSMICPREVSFTVSDSGVYCSLCIDET